MATGTGALSAYIPSPPINGFHVGPLDVHFYALGYIIGITLAILITRRRWQALGGDPDLVNDIALWVVPAGIIGGRIYFDITTPDDIPHVWYGVFAVWTGGLGIWGGVALAAVVGAWRLRKLGITVGPFANAIAPALLVAQAVGRIGNYFNKELFGKPTTLPWGLEIPYQYRLSSGIPAQDLRFSTFQPSFLYELIWDLALAAFLIWLGHHARIKPWGLFALYVAGYSAYRIFEETIRIDSSEYFLGLRLNMFVAVALTAVGVVWFILAQLRPERPYTVLPPGPPEAAGAAEASPDEASPAEASPPASAGEVPTDKPGPNTTANAPEPGETATAPAANPSAPAPAPAVEPAVSATASAAKSGVGVTASVAKSGVSVAANVVESGVGVAAPVAKAGAGGPDPAAPDAALTTKAGTDDGAGGAIPLT